MALDESMSELVNVLQCLGGVWTILEASLKASPGLSHETCDFEGPIDWNES